MRPVVIQKDDLSRHLSKKMDATTFLLVGEIHGVRENVVVIRSLLGEMLKNFPDRQLVLAFEWD